MPEQSVADSTAPRPHLHRRQRGSCDRGEVHRVCAELETYRRVPSLPSSQRRRRYADLVAMVRCAGPYARVRVIRRLPACQALSRAVPYLPETELTLALHILGTDQCGIGGNVSHTLKRVARFADLIAGDPTCTFAAASYADVWRHWENSS